MDILQAIKSIIKLYPDKVAINDNYIKVTYSELEEWSYKIAYYLKSQGIGKEDVVAVYLERSYQSICSIIGVLLSGAAFLPINIKTPIERINYMLKTSYSKMTLIGDKTVTDMNGINVNEIIKNQVIYEREDLFNSVLDTDLSYVIFTSGSTGLPKGVMIEYEGMNHHIMEKIRILGMDKTSIVAYNAPIGFDISIWQMLAPLCVGGTIVVFTDRRLMNIRKFVKQLFEENITILEVVPTYLKLIIDECYKQNYSFISLKFVLSTGEELKASLAKQWVKLFSNVPLINAYGPTEASDDIMHGIITKDTITQIDELIPIGKPIKNISIYVMNNKLEECEINQIGELWVSGICVARGYIGNEEETKKYFSIDKYTKERLFMTGDLVSLGIDGNYYFYGRKDDQVKIHGNRIELHEIENCILSYTEIYDTKVFYNHNKNRIEAVFIANKPIVVEYLKAYLESKIPLYMIPSIFLQVKYFPVNMNGKFDINQLDDA